MLDYGCSKFLLGSDSSRGRAACTPVELRAPLSGCCEGGDTKPVVSLTLDHRTSWGAFICFFVFVECFCADGYAMHVTNLRSPRSATARLPFLDQLRTRPPSCSGRGPTLLKTAFPRSRPFFTHTTHRKQRRTPGCGALGQGRCERATGVPREPSGRCPGEWSRNQGFGVCECGWFARAPTRWQRCAGNAGAGGL